MAVDKAKYFSVLFERQNTKTLEALIGLLDAEIEAARNKLETCEVNVFQKFQGRIEALRMLKKSLLKEGRV